MSSYFGNIARGLATAAKGMTLTMRHLLRRKVTRQYPDPKDEYILPERARNRLYVNMDDCIGCDKCARACPVNCIEIDTVKAVPGEDLGVTSNGKKKALWVTRFDIDMAKCCYCSLCVWPCPTECIVMTDIFEFAETKREDLIYHYATMDATEASDHVENWKTWEIEANAQRAAQAAKRAAQEAEKATSALKAPPVALTVEGAIKPPPFAAKTSAAPSANAPSADASTANAPTNPSPAGGIKPPPFAAKGATKAAPPVSPNTANTPPASGVKPPPFAAKPSAIKPPPFKAPNAPPTQSPGEEGNA